MVYVKIRSWDKWSDTWTWLSLWCITWTRVYYSENSLKRVIDPIQPSTILLIQLLQTKENHKNTNKQKTQQKTQKTKQKIILKKT